MRRAKVDRNHAEVKAALEGVGFACWSTARLGDGFCDLVAVRRGQVVFVEVKDGQRVPSERKLTPAEQQFRAFVEGAGGAYRILLSAEDARDL